MLRGVWHIHDVGGHSHGRSHENAMLELAMTLLGKPSDEMSKLWQDKPLDAFTMAEDRAATITSKEVEEHSTQLMFDFGPPVTHGEPNPLCPKCGCYQYTLIESDNVKMNCQSCGVEIEIERVEKTTYTTILSQ